MKRGLEEYIAGIEPVDEKARLAANLRLNQVAKPLHGLGMLEDFLCQIAAIQGSPEIKLAKKGVVIFCADNGVVEEGVTQTSQNVTRQVYLNLQKGVSSVCVMAKHIGAEVISVDIGMAGPPVPSSSWGNKLLSGTNNITKGSAMPLSVCREALLEGIQIAGRLKEAGYDLAAAGEMGIGNTTTASALAACFLELPPDEVTGPGAGLSREGLERKRQAVKKALNLNRPDPKRPLEALAKVGGLDIAGMAGLFLGGAYYRLPVVVDGVVSSVAALVACRLAPAARAYLLPSHASKEPAGRRLLEVLEMQAPLDCHMGLGEGTGAVALMALLDLAEQVYHKAIRFEDTGILQYEEQS